MVSDIPTGDGNFANLFLECTVGAPTLFTLYCGHSYAIHSHTFGLSGRVFFLFYFAHFTDKSDRDRGETEFCVGLSANQFFSDFRWS